jgi:hypothetical protein
MSKRTNTWQKATALVPLALLSGAWTASLAVSSATAAGEAPGKLPDGSALPGKAIEAPASVSSPGEIAPGVPAGTADQVISTASTNGIPAAALAAYQRAAQVIDGADATCNLDWPLIAAIGRVESDHGRYGGNVLSSEGVSTPGIYGIPLDGTNGTQKISDTDAGQYDQDQIFDRAVGPMQFIPSTWSVVGVDGDGDGKRNPQDIDDAALATAVYLCSGTDDLSTDAGQSAAVYRYNHSQAYVDLVKSIAAAYAAGDYISTPTSSYSSVYFGQSYDDSVFNTGTKGHHAQHHGTKNQGNTSTGTGGSSTTPTTPTTPPGGSDDTGTPAKNPGEDLTDVITKLPETVNDTLTPLQEATAYCQANLTQSELDLLGGLQACAQAYLDGGANAINNLLEGLLGGLLGGPLPKP